MIRYALKCADGHQFESWFQSASAYETLATAGHVVCAICGSKKVTKELMAPRVSGGDTAPETPPERPLSLAPEHPAEAALAALKKHIEANSTYVGRSFATKAREMHLGDTPHAPIHGEAAPEEAKALLDEGIAVAPLPFRPSKTSN